MPVMDINHSDRCEFLVSMSSTAVMLNRYADLFYGPDHPYAVKEMKQGDYNCTLLRTAGGKVYTLNFDTNTPRPRAAIRGHGGGQMTTPLSWHRLFEALVEQRVTDFDVYDSVTSSVISPLSEMSVANNSEPVEFPDFTKGKWKESWPENSGSPFHAY